MAALKHRNIRERQQVLLEIALKGLYGSALVQPEPIAGSPALHAWTVHAWGKWGHTPKIRASPLSVQECPTILGRGMAIAQDQRADIHPIVMAPHSQAPVPGPKDYMYHKIRAAQRERGALLHGAVLLGGPSGPVDKKKLLGALLFSPSGRRLFHWNIFMSGGDIPPWHDGQAGVWDALSGAWAWAPPKVRVRIDVLKQDPVLRSLLVDFPLPEPAIVPVEVVPDTKPASV